MSRSYEETKAAIVASLFSRKDEEGNLEEVLISFLKIQEVEGGHTKSRYLMLAGEDAGGHGTAADSSDQGRKVCDPQVQEEHEWVLLEGQDMAAGRYAGA